MWTLLPLTGRTSAKSSISLPNPRMGNAARIATANASNTPDVTVKNAMNTSEFVSFPKRRRREEQEEGRRERGRAGQRKILHPPH